MFNADLIPSSGDVNAKGKLRKRISRLWPFAATKTHQLEKQRKRQLAEKMTSLGNLELVVFDLELRRPHRQHRRSGREWPN